MKIYKYPLALSDEIRVLMPVDARLLCIQIQSGTPCIWAAVDPNALMAVRVIYIAGTGHERQDIAVDKYIGTFQLMEGSLVFHVFDGGELKGANNG